MYLCSLFSLNLEIVYKINNSIFQNYYRRFICYYAISLIFAVGSIAGFSFLGEIGKRNDRTCGILFKMISIILIALMYGMILLMGLYCIIVCLKKLTKTQRKSLSFLIKVSLLSAVVQELRIIFFSFASQTIDDDLSNFIDLSLGILILTLWITEKKFLKLFSTSKKPKMSALDINNARKSLNLKLTGNLELNFIGDLFTNLTIQVRSI